MGTFRREVAEALPPTPVTLAEAFARLGVLAGATRDDVASRLPALAGSEREALFAGLAALAPLLAPLQAERPGSLLGRLLSGDPFDGEVSSRALPKEARKALKAGEVVASSDADVWIFVERPDGSVQVSHAHPESFAVLGESVAEWLAAEAAAIEAARKPKKKPAKKSAEVGKPAIDAALCRLLDLAGTKEGLQAKLTATPHPTKLTRWQYFARALDLCVGAWDMAALAPLEGRLLGRLLSGRPNDTDDETCEVDERDKELDGINPVYVKRYPKHAQKLVAEVRPTHFVASSGPEIWFILLEAKGAPSSWNVSVHHAAYDGYELLSPTLEGWLANEVRLVEAASTR